jgi:putative ABC transport system permease protein
LRAYALSIFEQTFQVTRALNVIGLFVACVGLLLGLIALFEECRVTWRTLAFIGFSRREIIWVGALEGAGLSLVAWLSGTTFGALTRLAFVGCN